MKEIDEEAVPLPTKLKRLRTKRENKQKNKLKDLLHDSRSASEIAREASEDDIWLPD